eukprot:6795737-Pyramimonas_sp.AAC.1
MGRRAIWIFSPSAAADSTLASWVQEWGGSNCQNCCITFPGDVEAMQSPRGSQILLPDIIRISCSSLLSVPFVTILDASLIPPAHPETVNRRVALIRDV